MMVAWMEAWEAWEVWEVWVAWVVWVAWEVWASEHSMHLCFHEANRTVGASFVIFFLWGRCVYLGVSSRRRVHLACSCVGCATCTCAQLCSCLLRAMASFVIFFLWG